MSGARHQKTARRWEQKGTLDPRIKKALLHADPTFFDAPGRRAPREDWFVKADRMIAIRRKLGMFPSARSEDKDLRSSGIWWSSIRHAAKGDTLPADRAAYLDERCPGWRDGNSHLWFEECDRHIALRRQLGKFPSPRSEDKDLRSSGTWWRDLRQAVESDTLPADRAAYLDERCPGWRDGNSHLWFEECDRHIALRRQLGMFPSTTSEDKDLRSSGKWWENLRQAAENGALPADRDAYLDERCPGWRDGNSHLWFEECDRHIALRRQLGKFPSPRSEDKDMRTSGKWWENLRQAAKNDTLPADRAAYLDEHCPVWRTGNRTVPGSSA